MHTAANNTKQCTSNTVLRNYVCTYTVYDSQPTFFVNPRTQTHRKHKPPVINAVCFDGYAADRQTTYHFSIRYWQSKHSSYFMAVISASSSRRCTCEIKCRIAMAKAAFNKKRTLFTSTLDLELRKKLVKCYVWSIALYGAETWTLREMDQKHLEIFEMWCWRRMEKISWADHVRNEDVLLTVKEQRNVLHEIRKRKANWIVHILR